MPRQRPDRFDVLMVWFAAALYVGFFAIMAVGGLYLLWLLVTDSFDAPFLAWFFAGCMALIAGGKVIGWLMRERLLPAPLLARLQRTREGTTRTWVGRAGETIGMLSLGLMVVCAILFGADSAGAIFFLFTWLGVWLLSLMIDMTWAFLTDSASRTSSRTGQL